MSGPRCAPVPLLAAALLSGCLGFADPEEKPGCFPVSEELEGLESNLPLILVDTEGADDLEDDPEAFEEASGSGPAAYRRSALYAFDTPEGPNRFTDRPRQILRAGLRPRGNSSRDYDKKQFRMEIWDDDYDDLAVPLLDLPEEADWVLAAPFSDKTLMRNHLMFRWSREAGRYAPGTRFFELVVCSSREPAAWEDYRGVYVLTERIERGPDRVDIAALRPDENDGNDVTGGYILRRDWFDEDAPDSWFETAVYADALQYEYPAPDRITGDQRAWIRGYLDDFERALASPAFAEPEEGWAGYIDAGSFIDHHLLVELARNVDGFVLSTTLVKDREAPLAMGPLWDFNGSLGNADYFEAWRTEGWHHENPEFPEDNPNGYRWYERLFEDPAFAQAHAARWRELRAGPLSDEALTASIDETAALLEDAAERNFEHWDILGEYVWPNAPGWEERVGYQEQVGYLRSWVLDRARWMDEELQ